MQRTNIKFTSTDHNTCKIVKHRDSKNDWRDSCDIKMNILEFSELLTNLKILFEI